MLNIICPTRNELDDIAKIIDEKYTSDKKNTLKKITTKLINRYSDFAQIELNNRLTAVTYTDEEKESLLSLYSSKTATAKLITDSILRSQLAKQAGCCLSCGIGEVDQIDHFLPQEHFPEYSILHKNLTPICGLCNEIKGQNIPGNGKNYIHSMFDSIPIEPYLTCSINYTSTTPTGHFSILPKFNSHLVNNHFTDLKLESRLQEKSTQYFLQIRAYKTELGDEFAKEEIQRDLQKIGICFGTNFWKYLLCEKMNQTSFVDQI